MVVGRPLSEVAEEEEVAGVDAEAVRGNTARQVAVRSDR